MSHHKYLIVGGGMTADAALRGIREVDEEGSAAIFSEEPDPPYDRPPLSKGLWNDTEEDRIWRGTGDLGVELFLDRRVIRIDPKQRSVSDDHGGVYTYEKLLLATGGTPRKLEDAVPQVLYFRTYRDYRTLRELAAEGESFAVVGGSFIGSEIAAALAMNGKGVTLLFPEDGICRRIFPPSLSDHLNGYYGKKGVEVRAGAEVASVRRHGDTLLVSVGGEDPETLRVDGVVAGIGIEPNVELAETAGLDVEDGIVVDSTFRTSAPHVYAAGDVASFYSPILDTQLRVEHEDHANTSGRYAGRAMAGEAEEYDHIPLFYSDLFDLGYEAVGELDSGMRIVEDWSEPGEKGVLYYLRNDRVRGVLLFNVWKKVKEARALIAEQRVVEPEDLKGRISPD